MNMKALCVAFIMAASTPAFAEAPKTLWNGITTDTTRADLEARFPKKGFDATKMDQVVWHSNEMKVFNYKITDTCKVAIWIDFDNDKVKKVAVIGQWSPFTDTTRECGEMIRNTVFEKYGAPETSNAHTEGFGEYSSLSRAQGRPITREVAEWVKDGVSVKYNGVQDNRSYFNVSYQAIESAPANVF